MPSYKVIYFNARARAEPLRFLLAYGNLEYEDVRVEKKDWPALKPTMPMGQMPVLEVDGKRIHQSVPIARYLGKVVGLGGADAWEDLEIDSVVETINDLKQKMRSVNLEKDPAVQATQREALEKETIPFYLGKLDEAAKKNGGHFALGRLSWADVYFAAMSVDFFAKRDIIEKYPNVKAVTEKVLAIDSIKKWVAKRPATDF